MALALYVRGGSIQSDLRTGRRTNLTLMLNAHSFCLAFRKKVCANTEAEGFCESSMEPDWPGKISQLGQVLCQLATPDMTMKVYYLHYADGPRGRKLLFFTFTRTRPSTYKNKMDMAEQAFPDKSLNTIKR